MNISGARMLRPALSLCVLLGAGAAGATSLSVVIRTASGAPVADNFNIQTAGPRGPALLQDIWLLEKLAHFDREVIPERRMHAKGSGAYGTFTVTSDITRYSSASVFAEVGKTTEMVVRFSTVAGERGAADAERDIRGFAVRFYTDEGNWDIVGNNTPVFFFRDALKFPDLNHAVKRDPRTNLRSAENNWDFWTNLPEALHQVTIVMSDRGLPDGYRHMNGFGSHTFSLINARGQRVWVKWHFKTQQGIKNLDAAEASRLAGADPDHAQRDLFHAIAAGDFPRWNVYIQVMPEADADAWEQRTGWNPFDLTKVWPHKDYPRLPVGVLELNRNPDNYHAEVEQAAFSPATRASSARSPAFRDSSAARPFSPSAHAASPQAVRLPATSNAATRPISFDDLAAAPQPPAQPQPAAQQGGAA